MSADKEDFIAAIALFGMVAIPLAAIAGWVMNIAEIWRLAHHPVTAEIIIRAIGIVVWPLGCVLGWLQ